MEELSDCVLQENPDCADFILALKDELQGVDIEQCDFYQDLLQ